MINTARWLVFIKTAAMICFLVVFDRALSAGWDVGKVVILFVCAAVFLLLFLVTQVKSGIWQLVHTPSTKLDERELDLTREALRYAYGWFTVIVLCLLLSVSVFEVMLEVLERSGILLFAFLLVIAHSLPGDVMVWRAGMPVAEDGRE